MHCIQIIIVQLKESEKRKYFTIHEFIYMRFTTFSMKTQWIMMEIY